MAVHMADVRTAYSPEYASEERFISLASVSLLLLPHKGAAIQDGVALDLAEVREGCLMVPWIARYNESALCDFCKIQGHAILNCHPLVREQQQ